MLVEVFLVLIQGLKYILLRILHVEGSALTEGLILFILYLGLERIL